MSWFAISVFFVLTITAWVKIVALTEERPLWREPDPVFQFIDVGISMVIAASLELIVAGLVIVRRASLDAMLSSFCLVALFVGYRWLGQALFAKRPCACLGNGLDWTGLSEGAQALLPLVVLSYIGAGSLLFLILGAFDRDSPLSK